MGEQKAIWPPVIAGTNVPKMSGDDGTRAQKVRKCGVHKRYPPTWMNKRAPLPEQAGSGLQVGWPLCSRSC